MTTQASLVEQQAQSSERVLALRDALLILPERQQDYLIDTTMAAITAEDHRTKRLTLARTFNKVTANVILSVHSSLDCAQAAVLCALHNKVHSSCDYSNDEILSAIEYCWNTWAVQSAVASTLPTLHSVHDQEKAIAALLQPETC